MTNQTLLTLLLSTIFSLISYIAENCLHDKIVITAEGVALENRKEFHPASETLID
ncbi:Uncharacterised protein [Chlamydia trachomatis]|nr:Uncharacterised protein [Chlamydia trachomatis]